jgi:archaellum component FlaC
LIYNCSNGVLIMEELLKQILIEIAGMKSEITGIKTNMVRLEHKVDGIYQSVVRMEEGQPLDIYAMLGNISNKVDSRDSEITVLNKRVFKLESDVERLNKQ